jgi:hypothetical protein
MTPTTPAPTLIEVRCTTCQRRLLDYVSALEHPVAAYGAANFFRSSS